MSNGGGCAVAGCDRPRIYSTLCNTHYRRRQRTGTTDAATPVRKAWAGVPLAERFWSHVDKENGECWAWTGRKTHRNPFRKPSPSYGRIVVDGRAVPVTHVAWMLATGEYPPVGMIVCHRCDNPPCVRPDHLFLGTYSDNMRDAQAKGRRPKASNP